MTGATAARPDGPAPAPATGAVVAHVFGDVRLVDQQAARLAGLVDPEFTAECGWDAAGQILAPPADHPQLGWTEPLPRPSRPQVCTVPGCQRAPGPHGLCRAHRSGQRLRGGSVPDYAAAPTRRALAPFGVCQVRACPRDRSGGRVAYCEAHQARWLREHRADPGLDEGRWRASTSPIVVTGQVSLAGMPPLITAQVLYGLQQRTRSGAHTRIEVLRLLVQQLRGLQADAVDTLAQHPPEGMGKEKRTVLWALARHSRLALTNPEAERVLDVWELEVFGLGGRLRFTVPLLIKCAAVRPVGDVSRDPPGRARSTVEPYPMPHVPSRPRDADGRNASIRASDYPSCTATGGSGEIAMMSASSGALRVRVVVAVGTVAVILIAAGAVWRYRSTPTVTPTGSHAAISEIAARISALKPFDDSSVGLQRSAYGGESRMGDFVCAKRLVEGTDSQLTVLEPEANPPRWPGEILVLNPEAAQFEPLSGVGRAPIGISLEHNPSDYRSSSEPIAEPNWDRYSKELKALLNDPKTPFHDTPARVRESLEDLYSVEQLAGGAGMSYHFGLGLAGIGADYSQSDTTERHRYAFIFKQIYYTVRALTPARPEELFTPSSLPALREKLTPSTRALYVSEIDYGRVVTLTVESSASREEARAVLNAAVRVGMHRVEGGLTAEEQTAAREVKIERTIRGGSGELAADAFGDVDKLISYIREGGQFTPSSPGLPIGYRVTNLGGSQPIAFQVAYQEQSCSRVSQQTRVTLDRINIRKSNAEICGRVWLEGSKFNLWSTDCATAERSISTTEPIIGTDGNSDILTVPADASLTVKVDMTVDGYFVDDHATRVEVIPRSDWKAGYTFDVPVGSNVFSLVLDITPN